MTSIISIAICALGVGFFIEAIAEIKNTPCTEKNGFPTCCNDFFYWSLEK
jgi:hypothetical protein